MKLIQYLLFLLAGLVAVSACKQEANKELAKAPGKKNQNMFGLGGIPRGLTLTSENLAPGYVMHAVTNSPFIYLLNRKGEVVHQWKGNYGVLGAYLNDDGSLIQNAVDPDFPVFAGGGQSGRIQKISWDSKILWDFEYATDQYLSHHDMAVLPNGNILAIAWEAKSFDEVLGAGRKAEMIPKDGLWPDKIVEIEPQGKRGGKIVWEWHVWDHLIQDYDPKKPNYGVPAEHPELLDFNVGEPLPPAISVDSMETLVAKGIQWRNQTVDNMGSDVYHFNAVNYNADLDQIAFSSPNLSEVFIIDHSTTTKEAASHKGGRYGKGGDFLYRWGNPENYQRGDSTQRKLFHQHDIRWIEKGLPGAGNLTVFNNDIPGRKDSLHYSAVFELSPPITEKGNYVLNEGGSYGPDKPTWTYTSPDSISFYSGFISGAHRMQNGNTFIDEGARGRFFEATPDGKILWEYLTPFRGDIRETNGDPVNPMPLVYIQFRSTFVPADHPAIAGKTLTPLDPQPTPYILPAPPGGKK